MNIRPFTSLIVIPLLTFILFCLKEGKRAVSLSPTGSPYINPAHQPGLHVAEARSQEPITGSHMGGMTWTLQPSLAASQSTHGQEPETRGGAETETQALIHEMQEGVWAFQVLSSTFVRCAPPCAYNHKKNCMKLFYCIYAFIWTVERFIQESKRLLKPEKESHSTSSNEWFKNAQNAWSSVTHPSTVLQCHSVLITTEQLSSR